MSDTADTADTADTVVVGAGSAGCALAARLGGDVLLLEAGPAARPAALRRVAALAAGHPYGEGVPALLRTGHRVLVPRGRGLGGSSAVNGASWTRATPADADGWGVPGWAWADLLPAHVRSETDHDLAGPLHGASGPVPVRRAAGALRAPATDRFLAAADRLGFAREDDKNAGGPPGAGPVPSNAVDGIRVDAATAYLAAPPPGLVVRCDAPVRRVLVDGDRAVGVELVDGSRVGAGRVVLAAGAIRSPRLLLRSGIGPADELRAAGVDVRVDLPGVGRGWSDHPCVFLPFAAADPPAHADAPAAQAALDWDAGADPAGDVGVLLFVRPFAPGGDLHLMCALQAPDSRGVLTLDGVEHRYLRTEHDRRRLRHAIRTAAELLRAGLGRRTAPDGDVLGSDRALDGWVAAHLGTCAHLCGSAAIGPVVDARLRVHGVRGLHVADTSVLPTVPRRGPAATAVAVGELAADLLRRT